MAATRRGIDRADGAKRSGAWKKSTGPSAGRTPPTRLTGARGVDKKGTKFGRPPKPFETPERPTGKIDLSDLDSRNVRTSRGWVQGYNAQAVCTEDQIVIAAEVTVDSPTSVAWNR